MSEFVTSEDAAASIGRGTAVVLRYLGDVLDREDRLESGTGEWLAEFLSDSDLRAGAVRQSVLRTIGMGVDPMNLAILEQLTPSVGTPAAGLVGATGLDRLALAERVADLVSAGLAAKLPEADQVVGTASGAALVQIVRSAVEHGVRELEQPE